MTKIIAGDRDHNGAILGAKTTLRGVKHSRQGVILLAVLIFVAGLLPLITLVLTSINTESVSTAQAIKGAKTELGSEKSLYDAISLVVQEKQYPDYWTSFYQSARFPLVDTAIIVIDPVTGARRNQLPDPAPASPSGGAAGLDDVLGTGDDYWVGPRMDGSYIGASLTGISDNTASSRNYRYDFNFINLHSPTYLGQSWSFSNTNRIYSKSKFSGNDLWLFNQFGAVDSNQTNPPVDDGYDIDNPFDWMGGNSNAMLYGPGYYVGADQPRVGGPGGPVDRQLDSASIRASMYNARVSIYESVFTDHGRGPIPSTLLKSYSNITDEAGRLNLNIFLKKLPVMMTENANTDYDFYGFGTDDFNYNTMFGEIGYKWVDNPLFPDALSTLKLEFNPLGSDNASLASPPNSSHMFYLSNNFDSTSSSTIDFGSVNFDPLAFSPFIPGSDGEAMPSLGESVQHYYEGDNDGDGVAESVESMLQSIRMLIAIPGIDPSLAAAILEYMNPSLDYFADLAADRGLSAGYYIPGSGDFPSGGAEAYVAAELGIYREDSCNVTPALIAININSAGGVVNDFNWNFSFSDFDDLPLPPPRQLRTLEELLNVPGMTRRKFERVKDHLTIFSYDTNYIGTNIQDVSPTADLVNAYRPGDPAYSGSTQRDTPAASFDTDDLADLRYDIARFTEIGTVSGYREEAEGMYAYIREHLPKTMFDKISLPALDRLGRATAFESYVANDASMFDLSIGGDLLLTGLPPMVPHRDGDGDVDGSGRSHPYNIGPHGHEQDITDAGGTFPGAGYPAMNPEFTLDSCLSIVMYRNGTRDETDDYTYNPTDPAWLPEASRRPPFLFDLLPPRFFRMIGNLFVNNDPDPNAGQNVNPRVRPHASGGSALLGIGSPEDMLANLLMPGSFDSVADLLDVPLYEFNKMSISLLSDPPSDYRFDINNNGLVEGAHPEQGVVSHYIAFSDVVNLNWYMENVHPLGPNNVNDGGFPNGDDPDMDQVLYEIRFTSGNHGGITTLPDQTAPDTGDFDCLIPITPLQLRAIGGGVNSTSVDITIVAYDNQNNISLLGPDFTSSTAFTDVGGAGSLATNFGWDEVPEPEDPVYSRADSRPGNNSNWPAARPADWEKWAYDNNGDPYITARVEVVRANGGPILDYNTADRGATDVEDIRADENSKVYLQYNEESLAPLRVDLLPFRISSDQFEIRSSVGGYSTLGGTYLLYDWGYANGVGIFDFPSGYDGVWPTTNPQNGQAIDPRIARIAPEFTSIVLRVYDLRRFEDLAHSPFDANPPNRVAPDTSPNNGYPDLTLVNYPNGLWDDGVPGGIVGRVIPPGGDGTGLMGFPSAGTGLNGYEDPNHPDSPDFNNTTEPFRFGYAENRTRVEKITGSINVEAQISTAEPTVYLDDPEVRVYFGGAGGQLAYNFRIRLLSSLFGSVPGFGIGPYEGPDGLGGLSWPTPAPRRTRLTGAGVADYFPYDASAGGVVLTQTFANYNEISSDTVLDLTGVPAGQYWLELRLVDGLGITDYAYTKISVGTVVDSGSSSVISPELNISINLEPLELLGNSRLGFDAWVGIDGQSANPDDYSYYWELTRPVYRGAADANTIVGEEIVDVSAPFVGINSDATSGSAGTTGVAMFSGNATPRFEFHSFDNVNNDTQAPGSDGIRDANGVYFLHCYVLGQPPNSPPNSVNPFVAHDVTMVTISDPVGMSSLERTPMALLAANRPGNRSLPIGVNTFNQDGDPLARPTINPSGIDPPMAANGDVITINGTNFNTASPQSNIVHFGGNVSAAAFSATLTQLQVAVPTGATLGYVSVSNGDDTSNFVFFQTGYTVNFDLIGGLQIAGSLAGTYLSFELDFQGDGHIDANFSTLGDTSLPGQARGFSHDYAQDGIGNYMATLYVTDGISQRKAVSHQLITIADRDLSSPANNGMLVNVWPDVEMRSESFAPSFDRGVEFHSAYDGQPSLVQQKWTVDSNFGSGTSTPGGILIAAGSNKTTNVPGRQLYDPDVDFTQAGALGVRYQDLVVNVEGSHDEFGLIAGTSGATADVSNLLGLNTVVMHNPLDPSDGLSGGNLVTRREIVTGVDVISGGVNPVIEIQSSGVDGVGLYDWVGDRGGLVASVFEGGFIIGDIITNVNTGSTWVIIAMAPPVIPVTNNGIGWVQLEMIDPGSGGPGSPGHREFRVTTAVNMGGLPPRWQLQTSNNINWDTLSCLVVGGVGSIIYNLDDDPPHTPYPGHARWRIVDFPESNPYNDPYFGTLDPGWIEVEYVDSSTAVPGPPGWNDSPPDSGALELGCTNDQWTFGDIWSGGISGDEWRIGFAYQIYTDGSGGSGGSGFEGTVYADADYATEDAVVDFHFALEWPYDLNPGITLPTEIQVDWNGDGFIQEVFPVGQSTRGSAINGVESESVVISHDFNPNEYSDPSFAGKGQPTRAQFWIQATPRTQGTQLFGPYDLPVVLIGGDDYDNDLTRLNVRNYDATAWHLVTTEIHTGATILHASDSMLVPPGSDFPDTLQTWVSYTNPSIWANDVGETTMRHQGVHGMGGALNWMSDANADGRWQPNSNFESPLDSNAINYHEFRFPNGPNAMTDPFGLGNFVSVRGDSFPSALPGVGWQDVFGFTYFRADNGIYNGYGFITDNLPMAERAFSFDSQPIMVGDLTIGGPAPGALPLGVDFKIEPQVGTTSQMISLDSFVSGFDLLGTYNYTWYIDKVFDPLGDPAIGPLGVGKVFDGTSSNTGYLVFNPLSEILDEAWYTGPASVQGRYRVRLVVNGVTSGTREFWVEPPSPSIYVMADPPSASAGDFIMFWVFMEGGVAPYTVQADYGDGSPIDIEVVEDGNFTFFFHSFDVPSPDTFSPDGDYLVEVTWTDANGDTQTTTTVVKVADAIPLNANILVHPPSGVAPFVAEVHYSVAGGNTMFDDGYFVTVSLSSADGGFEGFEFRFERNTFGPNGVPDDPRDPNADDNPVLFTIPAPGNYQVNLSVFDSNGNMATATETIFAAGYLRPIEYGDSRPQVVRDKEDRPMHAVRIWTDPFLSLDESGNELYSNRQDAGTLRGGRLMEADLQVIGDIITVDPNQSFRSIGMNSAADPYSQELLFSDFADIAAASDGATDFYDTFTLGRININTASEETLTALFRKIRTNRGYRFNVGVDTDGDGSNDLILRTVRNPARDAFMTETSARALAQDVIRYRTAYFDMYKDTIDTSSEFGYRLDSPAGGNLGNFRVDHLPVIGPWDGANPRLYDIASRDADLGSANADLTNSWDHMAASFYNFDPGATSLGDNGMFYSPTDIAMVRERILTIDGNSVSFVISNPFTGGTIQLDTDELASNYAKYLNDVVTNDTWEAGDRGTHWGDWALTGLYPDSTFNYSQWAFDSRNYFTYDSGSILVDIAADDPPTSTTGSPAQARNNISIIKSNGETAYTFIPNPPFRHLFDLYKVIDDNQSPGTFRLEDVGNRYAMEITGGGMTPTSTSDRNYQVYSGPSRFRYVARWDDVAGEFLPIANYLDDIAPYVTCRSYVFRVESIGAINASGGAAGAVLDSARVNRDRIRTAVIDVGPFWARRDAPDIGQPGLGDIRTYSDRQVNYNLLWYHDEGR